MLTQLDEEHVTMGVTYCEQTSVLDTVERVLSCFIMGVIHGIANKLIKKCLNRTKVIHRLYDAVTGLKNKILGYQ